MVCFQLLIEFDLIPLFFRFSSQLSLQVLAYPNQTSQKTQVGYSLC